MTYDPKDPNREQIFLYHAYALGLGGYIERDGQMMAIPSIGDAALSIAGGVSNTTVGEWRWAPPFEPPGGFFIAVEGVTTRLWSKEDEHSWTTNAEVRVFGFNLCGRVKIGLMVNRITSKQKKRRAPDFNAERDHESRISFKDSQFWNVTVDGEEVSVPIDRDDRHQTHSELKKAIKEDREAKGGGSFCANSLIDAPQGSPDYVTDLARIWSKADRLSRCSIVKEVKAKRPENLKHVSITGYSMELPDFGRIFFGEMVVGDGMKRLNMIRWDLGCDSCGGGTGGGSDMNGEPVP